MRCPARSTRRARDSAGECALGKACARKPEELQELFADKYAICFPQEIERELPVLEKGKEVGKNAVRE